MGEIMLESEKATMEHILEKIKKAETPEVGCEWSHALKHLMEAIHTRVSIEKS